MADSNIHVGEGGRKSKAPRRQFVVALVVAFVLAVGAGGFARWLTNKPADPTPDSSARLPAVVEDLETLRVGGKTEEAIEKVHTMLNDPATSDDTKYMLYMQEGNIAADAQKPADAVISYEKAAAIKETFSITSLLGNTYARIPDKAKAIFWYKKAIPLVPKENNPVYQDDVDTLKDAIARMEALP